MKLKLWSSTALSSSAAGIDSIICDTIPLLTCEDRLFTVSVSPQAMQCRDKTKFCSTGNIEKSSLFGEVILAKHENHTPMIDGVATLSNS